MTRIAIVAVSALAIATSPVDAGAQHRVESATPSTAEVSPAAPTPMPNTFPSRMLLAGAGGAAGFIALGYVAFAVKGGPDGCDLCWETTVAAFVGSTLGAAGAATLAGGDLKKGLAGAALGAVAGLAIIGFLDEVADPSEATFVVSYALTQSLMTAWFSGR